MELHMKPVVEKMAKSNSVGTVPGGGMAMIFLQ
jgi:hypothetical protein